MFKDRSRPPLQTGIPKECHELTREVVEAVVARMLSPAEEEDEEYDPIRLVEMLSTNPLIQLPCRSAL